MNDVVLRPGRDRSLRRRHPWVLSGSVERVTGDPASGDEVKVLSAAGETLGVGHYAPTSHLRVRMLSFGKDAASGNALLEERITRAVERRADDPALADTDALRLVNAEGDGLPGLLVDRYADAIVVKCNTAGMHRRRDVISAALRKATGAGLGFARADGAAARREGFAAESGSLWGGDLPESVEIREGECRFRVDLVSGQKTGFYLDQRDARARVAALAKGRKVLDAFSYTGAFATAAARGGAASVTAVDSSAEAVAQAERHLEANAPECPRIVERADVFRFLRHSEERYDLLVIDPPPLARQRRDVTRATKAHKDVLLQALRVANEGAWLLAFSCSHHIGADLFRKVAFGASLDAGRTLQVAASLDPPSDHPVALDHPEGAYLTGLLLRCTA